MEIRESWEFKHQRQLEMAKEMNIWFRQPRYYGDEKNVMRLKMHELANDHTEFSLDLRLQEAIRRHDKGFTNQKNNYLGLVIKLTKIQKEQLEKAKQAKKVEAQKLWEEKGLENHKRLRAEEIAEFDKILSREIPTEYNKLKWLKGKLRNIRPAFAWIVFGQGQFEEEMQNIKREYNANDSELQRVYAQKEDMLTKVEELMEIGEAQHEADKEAKKLAEEAELETMLGTYGKSHIHIMDKATFKKFVRAITTRYAGQTSDEMLSFHEEVLRVVINAQSNSAAWHAPGSSASLSSYSKFWINRSGRVGEPVRWRSKKGNFCSTWQSYRVQGNIDECFEQIKNQLI